MDRHHEIEVAYDCEIYPLNYGQNNTPTPDRDFVSQFLLDDDEDDYDQYFNLKVTYENWYYWQFPCRYHNVDRTNHDFSNIPKHTMHNLVNRILCYAHDVPEASRVAMKEKILAEAENMANVTHRNDKSLHMKVIISLHTWIYNDEDEDDDVNDIIIEDDDDYDRVVEESLEDGGGNILLVPASESSIEGLEMVKVDQQKELCDCAICFEDLKVDCDDDVVVRMPCLHLFHRNCIVTWLKRTNVCPLCRFQMPTSDS